ncbi:hypothetical protein DEHRE_07375 [Dehalobacter restrictus DSM 9455]|uniref:Transposase n=1 Tax=Dehalobacter restrictus (strain DSM 9455 / PER-K23) TaxID=871738 RepID=A0ABN4BVV8_DEHRP|nr:hypothetical protein DEHRE_07375 [Dehalobacter restrictus DSM 9455]
MYSINPLLESYNIYADKNCCYEDLLKKLMISLKATVPL